MKNVIVGVLALILFLLVLQFGPNGLYHREQALNNEVAKARTASGQADTLSPIPAATDSATVAQTPAPRIDTDTGTPAAPTPAPAPKTSTPAPAPAVEPAPVAQTPAAPAPVPAPETPAAPAPAPVVAATPVPETPAPAPEKAPEPAPAPAPAPAVATTLPAPTPTPSVTPAPTPTPAPAAVTTASAPVATPAVAATPTAPKVRAKLYSPKVMILGYYRFTEPGSTGPNTIPNRLATETFNQQLAWLRDNGFQVIPLSQLVQSLKTGTPLPEHAVVITINNGFSNAVTAAAPLLRQYNFPWSFLIYTDFIEQSPKAASWSSILALDKEGVEVGSQSKSHPWLTDMAGKSQEQYDKWLINELTGSRRMLELKLKKPVTVLAYPYGNTNDVVTKKALALGYDTLLTTSGEPVTASSSPQNLGRLIINQFTAPYFETILSQRDFLLTNLQPAASTQIHDARPVISANLRYAGKINPKSVQVELSTGGSYRNVYDPATQTIAFPVKKDLLEGPVIVVVKAKDQDTGSPIVAYWQFYYTK